MACPAAFRNKQFWKYKNYKTVLKRFSSAFTTGPKIIVLVQLGFIFLTSKTIIPTVHKYNITINIPQNNALNMKEHTYFYFASLRTFNAFELYF